MSFRPDESAQDRALRSRAAIPAFGKDTALNVARKDLRRVLERADQLELDLAAARAEIEQLKQQAARRETP